MVVVTLFTTSVVYAGLAEGTTRIFGIVNNRFSRRISLPLGMCPPRLALRGVSDLGISAKGKLGVGLLGKPARRDVPGLTLFGFEGRDLLDAFAHHAGGLPAGFDGDGVSVCVR